MIYLALLPYGLNDPSVNKTFIREFSIRDKPYYLIKITFDLRGGGDDHEDVFFYWINKDQFTVDYFAYSYHADEGGVRFREATIKDGLNEYSFRTILIISLHQKRYPLRNWKICFWQMNWKSVPRSIWRIFLLTVWSYNKSLY